MNISFTRKILFGFIIITFLGVLGNLFIMLMSGRVNTASASILDIQRADFLVGKMEETVKIEGKLCRRYQRDRDTSAYGEFTLAVESFNKLVEEFRSRKFWTDAELQTAFNRVVAAHNVFLSHFSEGALRPEHFLKSGYSEEVDRNLDLLDKAFPPVHLVLQQRVEGKIGLLEGAIGYMNRMVAVLLVVTLVVAVGLCVFITRSILIPFRKLLLGTRKIGEGQFDYALDVENADEEVRELIEAFEQMARMLQKYRDNLIQTERFNAISSIAASVSHEVNNPLMIISGNAEFVRSVKAGDDRDTAEKMADIIREVERISVITKKLSHIKEIILEDYSLKSSAEWGAGKLIDIAGSAKGEKGAKK